MISAVCCNCYHAYLKYEKLVGGQMAPMVYCGKLNEDRFYASCCEDWEGKLNESKS
jgi:hypothetical protein